MKQKTGRRVLSFLLTLAMVVGMMPGMSLTAYAADVDTTYTITIPSTLTVSGSGWNDAGGISATGTLATGKKLTVTASSANNWALKSGDNSVGYNLATATGTYSSTAQPASWEFTELSDTAATKPMGIIVEDYSTKPAGNYQDTVTFTASVEAVNLSLSDFKENGAVLQVVFKISSHTLSVTLKNNSGTVSCTEYKFNGYSGTMSQLTVSLSGDKLTITKTGGSSGTAQLEFDLNNSTYSMVQNVSEVTAVSVNGIDITSKLSQQTDN
jgi:hypothetical protein